MPTTVDMESDVSQLPEHVVIDGLRFADPKETGKVPERRYRVLSPYRDDFGVGDFMDIKKMVDWCALTGQKDTSDFAYQ